MEREAYIHFIAGGLAGTAGAVITCPLEVVKTRLQSSVATFGHSFAPNVQVIPATPFGNLGSATTCSTWPTTGNGKGRLSLGLLLCIKEIKSTEGWRGLFKGLGPNLLGVCPSRACYFFTYTNMKKYLNNYFVPESTMVHLLSSATGGFVANTITNPIWFVKTRLQLDQQKESSLNIRECVRDIHKKNGVLGFYKGISASYVGISETVIYFVTYEALKKHLCRSNDYDQILWIDFAKFMFASVVSKSFATVIAYPHEVARTRLRQEGSKYKTFIQTLLLVKKEEGVRALYRGLATQFARQIPNSAIVMVTYEAIVYFCSKH